MNFLIKVEIIVGECEYRDWAIVGAENMAEAEKMAIAQVIIDNDGNEASEGLKYWIKKDRKDMNTIVKLKSVEPISHDDMLVLTKYGIAYNI